MAFDHSQALQSTIDSLDQVPVIGELTHSEEAFSALFSSEMAAAGLEDGGALGSLNCPEITERDGLGGLAHFFSDAEVANPERQQITDLSLIQDASNGGAKCKIIRV